MEGSIICPNSGECIYSNTVRVTDGYFTVTGHGFAAGNCHSISMVTIREGAPPPPERLEFYFGSEMPVGAGADAILDDGLGFSHHADTGFDYGWDCDGDTTVDYSAGRRGLDRDNGLGINHFDRDSTCVVDDTHPAGDVNWQIAVPNGVYTLIVDFGEDDASTADAATHGCEVEGGIVCPNSGECVYRNTVWVTDGYFTITGHAFNAGSCHSISMVILESGAMNSPPESVEFYFGTDLPASASPGSILDPGLGYTHHDGTGLDYGWDCDGDVNVDYHGGRRGLDRDNGLGINHFDRDGTCDGNVNWQIAVPNGVYTAIVDFGEDAVDTADANTHGCEVEGSVICPNSGDCVFYNTVWVTDGYFTVTGHGFHRLNCHSISMVKLTSGAATPPPESVEFYFGIALPTDPGLHVSPDAILDEGAGFNHHPGSRGSGAVTATFEMFKFNIDPDDSRTGLRDWGGANSVQMAEIALYDWSGNWIPGAAATNPVGLEPFRNGSFCDNFGNPMNPGQNPCGELPDSAVDGNQAESGIANSNHKWLDFTRGDLVMTFRYPVTVASYDWRTANDAPARDPSKWTLEGSYDGVNWHVVDDSHASVAIEPSDARFAWQGPFNINVGGGLDYGWDCDGDVDVNFDGGRRGLDRDHGLGLNHFDRDGNCPGNVNWQIAVPNGAYTVQVDFGEDSWTHGCEVEGAIVCPGQLGDNRECLFGNTVWVTDGYFTITGHSHDEQTCHSISMVKLTSALDADAAGGRFGGFGNSGASSLPSRNLVAGLDYTRCVWDACRETCAETCAGDALATERCETCETCADAPESPTGLNVGYGRSRNAEGGGQSAMNGIRRCGATSQSTIGWGSPSDPGNSHGEPGAAIDGVKETGFGAGSCTHTDLAPAWWQVNLADGQPASKFLIDRVNIWHRSDCCRDRLETAQIFVSMTPDFNDASSVECAPLSDSSQEPETTSCRSADGSPIQVRSDGRQLHLSVLHCACCVG